MVAVGLRGLFEFDRRFAFGWSIVLGFSIPYGPDMWLPCLADGGCHVVKPGER